MRLAILALAALLYAGAAVAGETPPGSPLLNAAVTNPGKAPIAQARDLCLSYSVPTNTLLHCPYTPMCNRAFKEDWVEPCIEIMRKWHDDGYEDAAKKQAEVAERGRREQEQRDLDFVRGVAKEGGR